MSRSPNRSPGRRSTVVQEEDSEDSFDVELQNLEETVEEKQKNKPNEETEKAKMIPILKEAFDLWMLIEGEKKKI